MKSAILNLVPDTEYEIRIRAISGPLKSNWSTSISYTTVGSGDPPAPTGLTVAAQGTGLAISWTRSSDKDVAGYNVYLSTSAISVDAAGKVTGISPTYIVDGSYLLVQNLTKSITYHVRVEALGKNATRSIATAEVDQAMAAYLLVDRDLQVEGNVDMDTFSMATGAGDGYVLKSDGSGVGTWTDCGGWVVVTDATAAAAPNYGYLINRATKVTITLPVTAAVGDTLEIVGGVAAGGWHLAQNANQVVHFGTISTTTGTGGYLEATDHRDCIKLVCVVANTEWEVFSSIGNIAYI
jgi:hypothetical protein